MKRVNLKRKRNAAKLNSLGLKNKSPKTAVRPRRITADISNTHNRKNSSPKTKPKSRAKTVLKKPRSILTNFDKKMRCECDHKDLIGFKAETDKRYFAEKMDLFGTQCANCNVLFADKPVEKEGCYVPSSQQATYFCSGRIKYNCRHGYCQPCMIHSINAQGGRTRRRK